MMRVLVLGADGFVGRRTLAAIERAGMTAIAGSRRARTAGGKARVIVNATDRGSLAQAMIGIDAIVNCIAGAPATIVANAVALFAEAGDRRVVHLSSMAVYGDATGRITETAPLDERADGYAGAKRDAEAAARGNVVILRPGCVYGGGSPQWSARIAALLAARRIGDLGAGGDGCSNLVHVDDVARAIVAALSPRVKAGSIYNLAMPDAPDWNGYFLDYARALGTVPIARIPAWRLKVETKLLAIPLKLLEKAGGRFPPAIPPSLARLWRQDLRLDSSRASADLQLAWTPLAAGMAEAAATSRPRKAA